MLGDSRDQPAQRPAEFGLQHHAGFGCIGAQAQRIAIRIAETGLAGAAFVEPGARPVGGGEIEIGISRDQPALGLIRSKRGSGEQQRSDDGGKAGPTQQCDKERA